MSHDEVSAAPNQETKSRENLRPVRTLNLLSYREIQSLMSANEEVRSLFRLCALAVLNSGNEVDDVSSLIESYPDFEIDVKPQSRGPILDVRNAPISAFVDGNMIRGIQEHLFSVLRDVVYVNNALNGFYDLDSRRGVTEAVFDILRNANIVRPNLKPDLVVCWGGHSIGRNEYDFTKEVGYQLGLRGLNIATGCGPGAMKGPMKGATIGHSKQRIAPGRYVGLTEPGIIAAEPPNPIVNHLVIMPDIEKRLEAFVRLGHGLVVFPGGVGTAEEIFYLLGILLDPANADQPFPVVLTGPRSSAAYFEQIRRFLVNTVGEVAMSRLQIVIDDPAEVARIMDRGIDDVREYRRRHSDSFNFNWLLRVDPEFQRPFEVTHASMRTLRLHRDQPAHELAADLRRAFSGIVAGNVKAEGIREIERHGPFIIDGDAQLMKKMDLLLKDFVAQHRMKLPGGSAYEPCYKIATNNQ